MSSPDGRPVFISRVPWHEKPTGRAVSPSKPSLDDVWVDTTGQFVNGEGEPLNERDWDLSQADIDQQPKGV